MKNNSKILELHELFSNEYKLNKYYNDLSLKQKKAYGELHSTLTKVDLVTTKFDENELLSNIPYSLKDNISTKGIRTTGGSLLLDKYKPVFNATVYDNLINSKANLVSKDALDEFGLGGTGTWCAYGNVINPYDSNYITAGSSSGSCVNVAIDLSVFAIGTDTGDSIRHPSSFLNVVGFKPSYGLISRYGVFPFSPSLDTVGIIAKYVTDIAIVLSKIASEDEKDFTNIKVKKYEFYKNLEAIELKNIKFAYIKEASEFIDKNAKNDWDKYLDFLKTRLNIDSVSLGEDLVSVLLPTYEAISYSESTSSLANLTGMTFGEQIVGKDFKETCILTRTKFLGQQVKSRFLLGSYVLSQKYYNEIFVKSKKVRRIIKKKISELFKNYDCIIIPGAGSFTLSKEELKNNGMNKCDDLLLISNFTGNPSITIPAIKKNQLFLGVNLNCNWLEDQKLLNIALSLEEINNSYLV